jgi:hypothetical protein
VAGLVAMLASAALFFAGTANANTYPCSETEGQDAWANVRGTYVGVDPGNDPIGGWYWACVSPTGGEANQKWAVVTLYDPANSAPGAAVVAGGCTGVPGDPFPPGCSYLLKPTGAEVDPVTSTSLSGPSPSASAGSGAGTCVHANGSSTCPGPTLVGATVAPGDLPQPTATGGTNVCVGVQVGATCLGTVVTVPTTATVTVGGDTGNDTAEVEVAGTSHPLNIGRECVGTPMPC